MNHSKIDTLSFAMHLHLATRLSKNPLLLADMKKCVDTWLKSEKCPGSTGYLQQWLDAIEKGPEAVISLATETSEQGQVLRSCSPFGVIWTPKERWEFIRQWREDRGGKKI